MYCLVTHEIHHESEQYKSNPVIISFQHICILPSQSQIHALYRKLFVVYTTSNKNKMEYLPCLPTCVCVGMSMPCSVSMLLRKLSPLFLLHLLTRSSKLLPGGTSPFGLQVHRSTLFFLSTSEQRRKGPKVELTPHKNGIPKRSRLILSFNVNVKIAYTRVHCVI